MSSCDLNWPVLNCSIWIESNYCIQFESHGIVFADWHPEIHCEIPFLEPRSADECSADLFCTDSEHGQRSAMWFVSVVTSDVSAWYMAALLLANEETWLDAQLSWTATLMWSRNTQCKVLMLGHTVGTLASSSHKLWDKEEPFPALLTDLFSFRGKGTESTKGRITWWYQIVQMPCRFLLISNNCSDKTQMDVTLWQLVPYRAWALERRMLHRAISVRIGKESIEIMPCLKLFYVCMFLINPFWCAESNHPSTYTVRCDQLGSHTSLVFDDKEPGYSQLEALEV